MSYIDRNPRPSTLRNRAIAAYRKREREPRFLRRAQWVQVSDLADTGKVLAE